jgi:hypothetical protein
VERVLPVKGTILLEFQLFLDIPAILAGSVVPPFAFAALQGYKLNCCLLCCHKNLSCSFKKP